MQSWSLDAGEKPEDWRMVNTIFDRGFGSPFAVQAA